MKITNHAQKRLKERCGLQKKSKERIIEKVLAEGVSHSETKGRLNKWVTSLYFKTETANNIKVYGDNAYIFCEEILITVIPVPNDLKKDLKNMVKERRR